MQLLLIDSYKLLQFIIDPGQFLTIKNNRSWPTLPQLFPLISSSSVTRLLFSSTSILLYSQLPIFKPPPTPFSPSSLSQHLYSLPWLCDDSAREGGSDETMTDFWQDATRQAGKMAAVEGCGGQGWVVGGGGGAIGCSG
jgi:hypothetical protein